MKIYTVKQNNIQIAVINNSEILAPIVICIPNCFP